MSRGLGKMQSHILVEIENLGGEVLQNQLLWHLAELDSKIRRDRRIYDDVYEGEIEISYKNNFLRAANQLAENEKIKRKDRSINDLSELFTYYPFKTYKLEISALRKKLLPIAKNYLEHGYRESPYSFHSYPRFGTGDHELFILQNTKDTNPELYKTAKSKWLIVESEILNILALKKISQFNEWMRLVIKGRQLFLEERRLKYGPAFHTLLESFTSHKNSMPEPERKLLDKIHRFTYRIFKEDDIHRAVMKTALYRLANFKKGGAATLRKELKGFMLKECPDLIRSLPGHKDPPPSMGGLWLYDHATFSKLLDKLIDRHIFSAFRFISVR